MKLVLIGIQGSGKGTQAELLSKKYKIPHISVGELLREEADKNSAEGRKIKKIIDKGNLVSDALTIKLVKKELGKKGFILDGFPRTKNQATKLNKITEIDYVIQINLSDFEAKKRIQSRLECPKCGLIYSTLKKTMKKCKKCKTELKRRDDDNDLSVKKRIKLFHKTTKPILNNYQKKRVLKKINGNQPIKKVYSDILKEID